MNDREPCYAMADDPQQVVFETTVGSNISEEEPDDEDDIANPSCEALEHEKTALTHESQATDENGNV